MFTRYKGIEIPQNYSGSRFKNDAPPPITETKMHKPPTSSPTRTSISPMFESALKSNVQDTYQEVEAKEITDNVSDFELNNEITDDFFEENVDIIEPYNSEHTEQESEQKADHDDNNKSSLLDEFKPLITKMFRSVSSEDFLLIALVVMLMSEGSSEASELIMPLLLLLLYH